MSHLNDDGHDAIGFKTSSSKPKRSKTSLVADMPVQKDSEVKMHSVQCPSGFYTI